MYDANEVSRIANIYVEERVLDARKRHLESSIGKQARAVVVKFGELLIVAGQRLKGQSQQRTAAATSLSNR